MSLFADKIGIRIVPAIISFAMLLLFLAPFTKGIINIGNCFGAAASAVFSIVFVLYGSFSHFVSGLWSRPIGKVIVCIVSAAVIAGTLLAVIISVFMARAAADYPDSSDTTLVVLGCQVKNGGPSLMLRKRLNAAYDYLTENENVKVIVSGGQGNDEVISEAQCMKDYLVSKGISPERIFMEDSSTSTSENLAFSRKIILSENLPQHITIVTDGYHQLRAELIASEHNMRAYNISADTSWWLVPTYWVREWFGVVHYKLFG